MMDWSRRGVKLSSLALLLASTCVSSLKVECIRPCTLQSGPEDVSCRYRGKAQSDTPAGTRKQHSKVSRSLQPQASWIESLAALALVSPQQQGACLQGKVLGYSMSAQP